MARCAAVLWVLVLGLAGNSAGISYVESSTGLIPPNMEGGRTEVEMGDVDGDGNIDLVSIGDHGSPYVNTDEHGIMVWFGDGAAAWSVYQYGDFGYGGVALGDVNNDGFVDVGYGMHHNYSGVDFGDQLLEVALGDGSGKYWVPWDDGLATNGETWGMFCTDFADADNDGDLDLLSNSFGYGAGVHVYLNQGDGTWVQSFGFVGGNSTMDAKFGDVNGDGNVDFAVAHQNGTVYLGDGTGGFLLGDGNLPPPGTLGQLGPDLGDVNGDGKDELSFSNSNGGVEVWSWADTNAWADVSGSLPGSGGYEVTQLWDMDVDGFLDVAAFGTGRVTIWKGDGGSTWTQLVDFTTYSPGYSSAFRVGGDVDHNGYPDMVLVESEGSWPNDYNRARFYREASSPDSLWIAAVYPRGYEKFYGGSVKFIRWVTSVPESSAVVNLELSTTGPAGPWASIEDSLRDDGVYQWSVLDHVNSLNCYVRYTVFAAGDSATCMTPAPFEIISPSFVGDGGRLPRTVGVSMSLFPNPARGDMTISMPGMRDLPLTLGVYDVAGRLVRKIRVDPGMEEVAWNGRGEDGRPLATGTYHLRIEGMPESRSVKAVLLGR